MSSDRREIPSVALVHDYFVQDGGAEAVAIELAGLFPEAPIHTTFFEGDRFASRIDPRRIRAWGLAGRVPASPWFRPLLPAYIAHYSRLEVPATRLVISNSSTFARGAHARPPALHIAYVHSPMRFAWDVDDYLAHSSFPRLAKAGLHAVSPSLRLWDRRAGRGADVVVANSDNVRRRIRRAWGRDSWVIHPPVDVAGVAVSRDHDEFYLVATRLLAYKRVDLAVRAFARLERDLIVVGDGPERAILERLAGPRTRFVGHIERPRLVDLIRRCRALVAPGTEDFGIVAVEAMAAGRPVVAFAAGGALETVADGRTGILFEGASPTALAAAIERFEACDFDPAKAHEEALRFDRSVFRERWVALLTEVGLADVAPARNAARQPAGP